MDNSMRQFNILSHNLVVGRAHIYTSGGFAANMGTPRKRAVAAEPLGAPPIFRRACFSVALSHFGYRLGANVAHIQALVPATELVKKNVFIAVMLFVFAIVRTQYIFVHYVGYEVLVQSFAVNYSFAGFLQILDNVFHRILRLKRKNRFFRSVL